MLGGFESYILYLEKEMCPFDCTVELAGMWTVIFDSSAALVAV